MYMYMYIRISILNIEMRSNNIQNAKPKKANQPTFPERLKKSKQGQTRCQSWVGCGAKPVQNGSFFKGCNNNDNNNNSSNNNNNTSNNNNNNTSNNNNNHNDNDNKNNNNNNSGNNNSNNSNNNNSNSNSNNNNNNVNHSDNDNKDSKNNNDRFFVLKYQVFWYLQPKTWPDFTPKIGENEIFQMGWFNQQLPLDPLEPMEEWKFLRPKNMGYSYNP